MKNLAMLIGLCLLAASPLRATGTGADQDQNKKEHFQEMKKNILKYLDARIAILQKSRECLSAAADHEAAKKCHEQEQSDMKALQGSKKTERLQEIENQQKELEAKKQEILKEGSK